MEVVYHLTSSKHSVVNIDDLTIRLGVGRATAIITIEATTRQGLRWSNFYLGWRRLRSFHNRLHYKKLHDRFYTGTTYVRPKLQSLHGDSYIKFFSTKYHFKWAEPVASDIGDNVGNALLSSKQKFGVLDEFVTKKSPKQSGSGT